LWGRLWSKLAIELPPCANFWVSVGLRNEHSN
jgi:hypothetical protein